MPFESLDRTPPPLFHQGPSVWSRLLFFAALSIFLMVCDARFHLTRTLRTVVSTALYPLQWVADQPEALWNDAASQTQFFFHARTLNQKLQKQVLVQSAYLAQTAQLRLENQRLRALLALPANPTFTTKVAQVLFDVPDPFAAKVVINRGAVHGIEAGSPVMDEHGVLGQVTRVDLLTSEVTLLSNENHAIAVLNVRTGTRGIAYGEPKHGSALELRFMANNADVQKGDLLTTTGVDGVYPAGLPVARVYSVDRKAHSMFAQIECTPVANLRGAYHVLILSLPAHATQP